jgi:hypothetical protein
VEFDFDEVWSSDDITSKVCVFSKNSKKYEVEIQDNVCLAPWEVLTEKGYVKVACYALANENTVITTNATKFYVESTVKGELFETGGATPTVHTTILESIKNLEDKHNSDIDDLKSASDDLQQEITKIQTETVADVEKLKTETAKDVETLTDETKQIKTSVEDLKTDAEKTKTSVEDLKTVAGETKISLEKLEGKTRYISDDGNSVLSNNTMDVVAVDENILGVSSENYKNWSDILSGIRFTKDGIELKSGNSKVVLNGDEISFTANGNGISVGENGTEFVGATPYEGTIEMIGTVEDDIVSCDANDIEIVEEVETNE